MQKAIFCALFIASLVLNASALAQSSRVKHGPAQALGKGKVWTWVLQGEKGRPNALGLILSPQALEGLPEQQMVQVSLDFPKESLVTPFSHVSLDYVPQGHEPRGVYDVPHFDVHFNLLPREVRERITCEGADKPRCEERLPHRFIPAGYVMIPGGVPQMGAHWFDPASPEYNGLPFTATFIYGSHSGKLAFLEPMVTRAFLLGKPEFRKEIPGPQAYQAAGFYPSTYAVRTDPRNGNLIIALEGLEYFQSE